VAPASPGTADTRGPAALPAEPSPALTRGPAPLPTELIVVDNGSTDGTAAWLAAEWPRVEVEVSPEPLSFAAAVNRGIGRARYSRICLLNNDMLLEPGFFAALDGAFQAVPSLFCATAQIRFPAGVRREETGKAVMAQAHPDDFPIRCDEPIPGEDLSYVLYGSGGCSLYDSSMLRALGGADEAYAPAYVEDLDLGYRAWQRGWPTVFVAGAVVEHRHRATTSRYYSEAQLAEILERNYLRFLARAVSQGRLFRKLWKQALGRLRRRKDRALRFAAALALAHRPAGQPFCPEEEFLALTAGDVAVFPGRDASQEPLVMCADRLERPPDSALETHSEVVLVRQGKRLALRAARRWTGLKWAQRKRDTEGQAGTARGRPACPEN
jgi:GT2 family glycosyltransferase